MWVQLLASEDPLEEGMATHFSTLAWKILWTGEPGRLQSIGAHSQTRLKQLSMKHARTSVHQAPLSMEFSRQEWVAISSSRGFPFQVLNPRHLHCQEDSTTEPPVVLKFESASASPGGLPSPLPASSLVGMLLLLSHFSRVQLCATP